MANSVPLGQAGTGSAFVLGENTALKRYLENQDYNAQVDRQNALLEQKRQEEAEKQRRANWTAGAMKAQSGVILPSLDEENKLYMTSAKDLYNKGQDPYSPDSPLFDKRVELDMANSKRKELSTLYTQIANSIKDPNLYTKKSLDEFFNFPNLPYQEAFAKGVPKPELKFSPQDFLSKTKVGTAVDTLDSGGRTIKKQYTPEERLNSSIVNGLKNDPKFMSQFHELLDIPEKFDFDSLINLPSDPKKVLEDIDKEWKGSEVYRKELTQKIAKEYGITPSDPQFEAIKQQKAIEAYNASKKLKGYVEGLKEQKRNENPSVYSNTIDNATLNRERSLRKDAEEASNNQLGEPTRQSFKGNDTLDPKTDKVIQKGKSIYSDKFLSYDGGTVSIPQTDGVFNVQTQTTERMPAIGSANITGLGYFPHSDGKPRLMMSVVDDGTEYLIPDNKIPQDLKNSAKYKAVRNKLGSQTSQTQQAKPSQGASKGTVRFVMPNGQVGEIPADKAEAFSKKYPQAKRQ